MAVGWISVLKLVPWDEVISNAPKIAMKAKELWDKTSKKTPADQDQLKAAAKPPSPAELQARLETAEVHLAELRQQMSDSSELIKALANQNAQLVQRIARIRWATAAAGALGLLALLAAWFLRGG
ncbi:MAG TPA: hypothetical protein VLJ19_18610 [Variovorax sp.]|nr:hypothetical protein [Variovorax sp.]